MKFTQSGFLWVVCSQLLAGNAAQAIPSAYVSKHGALPIVNQTNSTLLRDSENPATVWVMPPTAGVTEFKGMVPSANLGFCSGIRELALATTDIDRRVAALSRKYEELEPDLKKAEQVLADARISSAKYAQRDDIKLMLSLEDSVESLQSRRTATIASLETCTQNCDILREEASRLLTEVTQAREDLRAFRIENRIAIRDFERAKANVEAAEQNYESVGAHVNRLRRDLISLNSDVMGMYATKGKLEGGIAQIDYDTGWNANIKSLEAQYRGFQFQAIPTANAHIDAQIVGAADQESYYQSLPMLLDYTINGVKYVPWGSTDHISAAVPSVIVGNFRLSTLGACPIADPHFFDGTGFVADRGALSTPKFAISATYQYPAAYKFKVTASYNLYKFYEQIKRHTVSGGFFSSKSVSETLESATDHDTFKIDWLVEDPNSEYDAKTRQQVTADLKKSLMERVLQTMAQPVVPMNGSATFTDPGAPPAAGAIVLANGLSETCGFNIFCQGGSWVLRGLFAIFGSSTTEQKFRSEWDRTATEQWSSEVASYRSGVMAFQR